jgi:predicted RNA-binding protein YlxR (DUF448 family)
MNVVNPPNERDSERKRARRGESRRPTRTCVGCGLRDSADALLRIVCTLERSERADGHEVCTLERSERADGHEVATPDELAFDLAGGTFGRGAHLHPRPACIEKAPKGLARGLRGAVKADAAFIGRRLVEACDRRMAGLVLAARRSGALVIGADAALGALAKGAPLAVVAVDAGSVAETAEVQRCAAEGRAIAWRTRSGLGGLLGERSVAICAVRHAGIADELKRMRVAADAGAAATTSATREGAECSRFPEAR